MSRRKFKKGAPAEKETTTGAQKESKATQGSTDRDPGVVEENKDKAKNDPEWYSRDPRLLIDAASVPYSEPFGAAIHTKLNSGVEINGLNTSQYGAYPGLSIPGIAVFNMEPNYGLTKDRLSPANVAATALYSQVRYVNNGRKNYDPADLFMYCAAVSELYSFLNWCRRVYGACMAYSQANRYVGKAVVTAMEVDADDILGNLANFRYWINAFTNKISSYAVPADLTLFSKRAFQYGSVYLEHDGESIKDQIYMYNPAAFYRFRLDAQSKGMLERIPFGDQSEHQAKLKWTEIRAFGESLLEKIWGDEDFGLMSGDVMRAFNGKILAVGELPEDYLIVPVHDKLVLTQMENTVVVHPVNAAYSDEPADKYIVIANMDNLKIQPNHIYQDLNGNIVSYRVGELDMSVANPDYTNLPAAFDQLVNIHEASGDPATTIEAVQNKVVGKGWTASGWSTTSKEGLDHTMLLDAGATVCVNVNFFLYENQPDSTFLTVRAFVQETGYTDQLTVYDLGREQVQCQLAFKYCPKLWAHLVTDHGGTTYLVKHDCIGRLDTYAYLPASSLMNILEVSLLSLLYVPGVAKYVNATA